MQQALDKKILVIDDDELVLKTMKNLLLKTGYKVTCASNAENAFNEIKKQEFDLIVSDIRMPGKNGVEAIREIRNIVSKHSPRDIPIIFITGYAEAVDELKAELLGEVILKPFDLEHLLMTIRDYL